MPPRKMTGNDARRLLTASVPDGLRFVPVIIDRCEMLIPLETLMDIRRSLENQEHAWRSESVLETPKYMKKKPLVFHGGDRSTDKKPLGRSDLHRRLNTANHLIAETFNSAGGAVHWPNQGPPNPLRGG